MLLGEIFGNSSRVRILEELVSKENIYLTVSEIARMADISKKTAYTHISILDQLGLVVKKEGKKNRYKLNHDDPRAIAIGIIENEEFLRKDNESFSHELNISNYSFDTKPVEKVEYVPIDLPPLVAKKLSELLIKEIKNYESEHGELPNL